mmetsp:Transcript_7768/g.22113  ORF Transcript_7768/g.22113 Transcript_7768/m.22113 type:complete len:281 (+) Transcript_7768:1320-2162(+)
MGVSKLMPGRLGTLRTSPSAPPTSLTRITSRRIMSRSPSCLATSSGVSPFCPASVGCAPILRSCRAVSSNFSCTARWRAEWPSASRRSTSPALQRSPKTGMTAVAPQAAATCSGVCRRRSSGKAVAPYPRSSKAMPGWPAEQARCNALAPSASGMSRMRMSTDTKACTTARWPFLAARWSGVSPFSRLVEMGEQPRCRSSSTTVSLPIAAAWWRADRPALSRAAGESPRSSSSSTTIRRPWKVDMHAVCSNVWPSLSTARKSPPLAMSSSTTAIWPLLEA